MLDLRATVERRRNVGQAERRFLERWIVEDLIVGPMLLDRLAVALAGGCGTDDEPERRLHPDPFSDEDS